jgi:hypothetical protein
MEITSPTSQNNIEPNDLSNLYEEMDKQFKKREFRNNIFLVVNICVFIINIIWATHSMFYSNQNIDTYMKKQLELQEMQLEQLKELSTIRAIHHENDSLK